jgi:hypothetical protein
MLKRNVLLAVCGILVGCAAESVMHGIRADTARAAGTAVDQYCTTTGDFNNVEALNSLVVGAGKKGWSLVGVYRPAPIGATHEDYVCFQRE